MTLSLLEDVLQVIARWFADPFIVIVDASSAHRTYRLVVQQPRVDALAMEIVSASQLLDHVLLLKLAQANAARGLLLFVRMVSTVDY